MKLRNFPNSKFPFTTQSSFSSSIPSFTLSLLLMNKSVTCSLLLRLFSISTWPLNISDNKGNHFSISLSPRSAHLHSFSPLHILYDAHTNSTHITRYFLASYSFITFYNSSFFHIFKSIHVTSKTLFFSLYFFTTCFRLLY